MFPGAHGYYEKKPSEKESLSRELEIYLFIINFPFDLLIFMKIVVPNLILAVHLCFF